MNQPFDQDGGDTQTAAPPPEDPHDYVDLPAERGPARTIVVVLVLLLVLVGVVGIGAKHWYDGKVDPSGPPGRKVAVVVESGSSFDTVVNQLADKDVISDATVFRFWSRGKQTPTVQAGTYEFRENMSFQEALDVIAGGPAPPPSTRVTVPEGLILPEIAAKVSSVDPQISVDSFLQATTDPSIRSAYQPADQPSLEGLLFPSTYDIGDNEDAASVVRRMVTEFDQVAGDVGLQAGADALGRTPYEVITVASLIQAEAGNPEEAPKIARVIYNRLQAGTPLGIDATSRYEAKITGSPTVDFSSDSPFNTRRHRGLPPTPIAAPGKAALEAALHPADGPWTYYVLESPGHHFFTDSASEFAKKKKECEAKNLGCG